MVTFILVQISTQMSPFQTFEYSGLQSYFTYKRTDYNLGLSTLAVFSMLVDITANSVKDVCVCV